MRYDLGPSNDAKSGPIEKYCDTNLWGYPGKFYVFLSIYPYNILGSEDAG
jgi:hypothetical protein